MRGIVDRACMTTLPLDHMTKLTSRRGSSTSSSPMLPGNQPAKQALVTEVNGLSHFTARQEQLHSIRVPTRATSESNAVPKVSTSA